MANKRQRVTALSVAIFFLITSAATTVAVVWTMMSSNNNSANNNNTNANASSQQAQQSSPLDGTKLANFTPVASIPTLQTIDTKVGTGATATAGATITVAYQGALAKDGTIFDASPDGKPVTFPLNQVIKGWQEGIPGMKIGGVRRIMIPAADAYGAQSPSASIPANSDLVFDVTLIAIK